MIFFKEDRKVRTIFDNMSFWKYCKTHPWEGVIALGMTIIVVLVVIIKLHS